jgi:uncharacterized RDD family membrane protein YckC
MPQQQYAFVFSGKLVQGCSEDEARAKLAESFGMPVERVERIFTGKPVVVKRGLDRATAEKFLRVFSAAGAVGEIRPEPRAEAAPDVAGREAPAASAGAPPQPQPAPTPHPTTAPSGFWRRVFAFWIDSLLIAIPGWLIGWAFYDQLVRIGQTGRLIGFVIALGYFGLFNSSLGNGQTLGKRLMKIQVVDLEGETIPLRRSVFRYVLLGLPFFCNGLNVNVQSLWIGIPLALVVFGLGGSILYLFIFNRHNRRTVHDFAAGTVVVRAKPRAVPAFSPVWRGHFVILALILVGLGVTGAVLIPSLQQKQPFAEMVTMQQSLQQERGIHTVGLQNGVTFSGDRTTRYFAVNIVVSDPHLDLEKTADRFASLILSQESQAEEKDLLVVNVSRGYDIGISSGWVNQKFSYTPAQWRSKLGIGRL